MILAALLAIAFGQANPPVTATYANNGARMEVILPELSKLTGLDLEASNEMAGRVLILRLDHAPIKETLNRIAHASYGRWAADGGAYVLYPDSERIEKETDAAKQARIADVAKALAGIGTVRPNPPATKRAEYFSNLGGEAECPTTLVFHALASAFDPAMIASLPLDGRVVYSTRPTPLQLPLPAGADGLFAQLLDQVRSRPDPSEDGTPLSYEIMSRMNDDGDDHRSAAEAKAGVAKADVEIEPSSGQLNVTISLFSSEGKLLAQGSFAKQFDTDDSSSGSTAEQPKPEKPIPLDVSQVVHDFVLYNAGKAAVTPTLRERLNDPLTYDPDSFMGEVMVAYAKAKGLQLVAAPPDSSSIPYYQFGTSITLVQGQSQCQDGAETDDGTKDGWIEIADSIDYPDDGTPRHLDRKVVAGALAAIPGNDGMTLLDLVHAKRAGVGLLGSLPQSWLCQKLVDAVSGANLQLVSALDDDEIEMLLAGKTLELGQVSRSFQDAFAAFSSSTMLQPSLEDPSPGDQRARNGDVGGDPPPFRTDDLWHEYTEVQDSYSPQRMKIKLATNEEKSLTASMPPGAPRYVPQIVTNGFITLDDVAPVGFVRRNVAGKEDVMPSLGAMSESLFESRPGLLYRMGTNHSYELEMFYSPHVYCEEDETTTTFAPGSKPGPFADLPADVQKAMRLMAASLQEFRQGQWSFGDSGGGPP